MFTRAAVSRRRILLGAASTVTARLFAQQVPAAGTPTFSADVKVVNVFATVRNKDGKIVKDLVKEDFMLLEDGQEQPIRYFARESGLPLTVGLIVDTTPSESRMLGAEKRTSLAFLNQILRPEKDRAFLIQFNEEVELLQDLTSSKERLQRALGKLSEASGGPGGGNPGNTILSDAIWLAAEDVLLAQTGRKAVIVLGDGDHVGSRKERAIAAAERADTAVYAIRIQDKSFGGGGGGGLGGLARIPGLGGPGIGGPGGPPGGGPMGGRDDKALKEIAIRTGGSYFESAKKDSLEQIYRDIEEELRSQYSLGYTPAVGTRSGYRHIKVEVNKKGLTVQARDGYYAGKG
jgi:VWFA-related protein